MPSTRDKFLYFLFLFSSIFYFLLADSIFAQEKSYFYDSINVAININKDSSFDVAEKQCFNFTGNFHYGHSYLSLSYVHGGVKHAY